MLWYTLVILSAIFIIRLYQPICKGVIEREVFPVIPPPLTLTLSRRARLFAVRFSRQL
jgi:hypothetical protein